jgi:hypothetical protein
MQGEVLVMALVFFAIFLGIAAALVNYITVYAKNERTQVAREETFALAEAGVDQAAGQLNQNPLYTGETDTALGAGTFTVAISTIDTDTKQVTVTAYVPNRSSPTAMKTLKVHVALNTDVVSFHYGIQAGQGGFLLSQSSTITGNVYSGGSVIGNGSAVNCGNPAISGYGNCIFGTVVSSGASGLVYGVTSTSSIYAHTIGNAGTKTTVTDKAYYATTITNTFDQNRNALPAAQKVPNSTDQPDVALPISDDQITEWEADAAAGGTLASTDCDTYAANTNTCTITSARSWGPIKIPFNLVLKNGSAVLTVAGPIWVTGNLTLQTGPTIQMAASLGSQNVAIIADNQSNRLGSGVVNIGQSTIFKGSGAANSFVFLISWNTNGEDGGAANGVCSSGSYDAICMGQSSSALVAYASHGQITFSQSASAKEATAYRIVLTQSANVAYDTGLPNTLFESGTGGSWTFVPGSYALTP